MFFWDLCKVVLSLDISNVFNCSHFFFLIFRSAGLLFFSALFVNLLTGILFLVGSNVAVICDDVPDYKLLEKVNINFLSIPKAMLLGVIFV